jgi:hypothetical protein
MSRADDRAARPKGGRIGEIGEFAAPGLLQKPALYRCHDSPCDKASPAAFVMLHLRSCYVSKAAILTIPVRSVPVENRSPT